MATLTIRNVPDDLVERLKATAKRKGLSMEQEVRELLQRSYLSKQEVLTRIRQRWDPKAAPSPEEVQDWIAAGRGQGDNDGL